MQFYLFALCSNLFLLFSSSLSQVLFGTNKKKNCIHTFMYCSFHRCVSLSRVHLTDLHHIFVCRVTLNSFGNIDNRGVYSNGHHLYWDSYCFASEHSGVQNLRVLHTERERERNQHGTSEGPRQVFDPPNSSRSVITSSKRPEKEKVPK